MDDSLVRAATTASSLEAEQDSGNINKTQFKATPNESSSQRTDSGGGPRFQDTMGIPLLRLEQTKATQANKIDSLKRRVKKIKKKQRSRTHKLKTLYKVGLTARVESSDDNEDLGEDASEQGRISDIDADEGITLVSTHDDAKVFDVDQDLDATLAQALAKLKHAKPKAKAKGIVFHEPKESTTAAIPKPKSPDKGKAKMIKDPVKLKKKDQIMLEEEVSLKTELVEESSKKAKAEAMNESSKRAGTQLEQESSKKQKIDDDKETTELKQLVKIILDEEGIAIDAIPLSVKPLSIVDWKIQKRGKEKLL
uniref:Uncharacterized protein n=1 Tax=Tanacetum cinerariifolium TaxID=118510 RepID=A0A6L2P5J6_TANCI|nr:hypothetical protein [Tanacetum cinerariifolium]